MNQIAIKLNGSEFTGGEAVSGQVLVQLDERTPTRGVRLFVQGYEKAVWREGGGKSRHTHAETRSFFDEEITFFGRSRLSVGELVGDSLRGIFSKEGYQTLEPGPHEYPFTYTLPADLPGDYESALSNSRIYYGLKAQVDIPLKRDLEAMQPLVIYEPSRASQAVAERRTKHFLFDSNSLVEAAVHLESDAFPVGGTVHCQLEVMNRAPGKDIHSASLALRQIEVLAANGHSRELHRDVSGVKLEHCRFPLKERATVEFVYEIPGDLYPTIERGALVKLGYELQVVLDIPWAIDAKLSVPIRLTRPSKQAAGGE